MNAPEKNVLKLAFTLFVLGIVIRILPWGLPSIESFQVGEAVIINYEEEMQRQKYAESLVANADKVNYKKESQNSPADPHSKKVKTAAKKIQLPLHVNSASVEDLCALNGVGPKLAEKIVSVREANGPFKSSSDLQKVPGIGKKKLEKLLPGLIFD